MSRRTELIALLISDTIAAALSCLLYLRIQFGEAFDWAGFTNPDNNQEVFPLYAVIGLALFWMIIFLFFGMYRERYASSRFDELVSLAKVVTIGVLVLVFAIFIDTLRAGASASIIFFYWASVLGIAAVGRIVVRSVQKALILRGYGLHKTLVVGWSDRVEQLYRDVARYPAAGLQIVGAVRLGQKGEQDLVISTDAPAYPLAGGNGAEVLASPATDVHAIEALPRLIDELDVQDVLISLGSDDQKELAEVLRLCDGKAVSLKLVPDFYSIIGGMARTEHVYGLPLIEVNPVPMPAWEQSTKRMIDFSVAFILLVAGLPLWITIGLLIRLTSPGPAIYRQQRVGKKARVFTMNKFRTMRQDAEAHTGPVWATEDDPRYTRLGRWLRKTRLDEIPQLWNVLKGDMSLVGPRPERPFFVEKLTKEIPLYSRRHRVKPGITGWAQVMWRYDTSLEDVKQKVKFDLFYIENMSLRMDFKILFRTIRTALTGQGQ